MLKWRTLVLLKTDRYCRMVFSYHLIIFFLYTRFSLKPFSVKLLSCIPQNLLVFWFIFDLWFFFLREKLTFQSKEAYCSVEPWTITSCYNSFRVSVRFEVLTVPKFFR